VNWYKKYIVAEKVQPEDKNFSWTYIDVPEEVMKIHRSVCKEVNEKDLYIEEGKEEGQWSFGIEDMPHVTLKYGFEFDDPKAVKDSLKGQKGGEVKISGMEIFEKDDNDVLVVRFKSDALSKLHEKLTDDLNIPDKFPEFKPHMTIAYFLKGRARKYKGLINEEFLDKPISFKFDTVYFEDRDDKKAVIKLSK